MILFRNILNRIVGLNRIYFWGEKVLSSLVIVLKIWMILEEGEEEIQISFKR